MKKPDWPWRTWKGLDRDAMNRLCEKGFISNPHNKNLSVDFTGTRERPRRGTVRVAVRESQWLRAFAEDAEIFFVSVDAAAGLAGELGDDALFYKQGEGGVDRGFGQAELTGQAR